MSNNYNDHNKLSKMFYCRWYKNYALKFPVAASICYIISHLKKVKIINSDEHVSEYFVEHEKIFFLVWRPPKLY